MNPSTNELTISNRALLKQFSFACLVAVLLLLTVVLPAEYQIDPLSTGKWLGINGMSAQISALDTTPIEVKDDLSVFRLSQSTSLFHTETKHIVIEGYEGVELKATMQQGDGFTFEWRTENGPIYIDMHGEYASNTEKFESYFKNEALSQHQGTFVAPFTGTHGWYWQNMQEEAITVSVTLAGFYSELHLKQE
jgi:hypothetical protein